MGKNLTAKIPEKIKVFLNAIEEAKKNNNEPFTPNFARSALSKTMAAFGELPDEPPTFKEHPLSLDGRDLKIRIYKPKDVTDYTILYFHGGGHMCGSIQDYHSVCCHLANKTKCAIISLEYSLAPEKPYPLGLQDCLNATLWIVDNAKILSIDPNKLILAGDSAGGNYAVMTSHHLKNTPKKPLGQILIYPAVDFSRQHKIESLQAGYYLEEAKINFLYDAYLPPKHDRHSPEISILFNEKLEGMPPTFIATAGYDPLRDEGLAFVEKLRQSNTQVDHKHYSNMIHGFMSFPKLCPKEVDDLLYDISTFTTELTNDNLGAQLRNV